MKLTEGVRSISFPLRSHPKGIELGSLVAIENGREAPFTIERVFYTVNVPDGAIRGAHAHRECRQLLIALKGLIEVQCTDGAATESFILDSADKGLLIEPGIWAEQKYMNGAILLAICDRIYEESDYIRNFRDYLVFKEN